MPILTIEVVANADGELGSSLAQSLADAVGRALDSPPGQTWIRLRPLGRDRYAENGSPVAAAELPVFVTVLEHHTPTGAELEAEIAALTSVIARTLGRPTSCVHIVYAPPAAGRVAFGGNLVR